MQYSFGSGGPDSCHDLCKNGQIGQDTCQGAHFCKVALSVLYLFKICLLCSPFQISNTPMYFKLIEIGSELLTNPL